MLISQAAFSLIVTEEVGGQAYYERHYTHPEWPGGNSGVTIAIGYDLGMCTAAKITADWKGRVPDVMLAVMVRCAGIHGDAARVLLPKVKAQINIPWTLALDVFASRDVPQWMAAVNRALPKCDRLNSTCFGVHVSLAYNRGAGGFNLPGDRYLEMRNIKAEMVQGLFGKIPAEYLSMRRIWPGVVGLQNRRKHEADLFSKGLLLGATAEVDVPVPAMADPTVLASSREDQQARTKPPATTPAQHTTAGGIGTAGAGAAQQAAASGMPGWQVAAIVIVAVVVAAGVWWWWYRNRNPKETQQIIMPTLTPAAT